MSLLLLNVLVAGSPLFAQPAFNSDSKFLRIGMGGVVALSSAADKHFSAMPYNGTNYGATLFFQKSNPFCFQEAKLMFVAGRLKAAGYTNTLSGKYFTADYSRLYTISRPNANTSVQLGPQLAILYAHRTYNGFINRQKAFEFAGSVAVSAMVSHTFQSGFFEGVLFSERLDVPLASTVQHPSYGNQETEANLNSESAGKSNILKGSKLQTAPDFLRLRNNIGLSKSWNRNGLSMVYSWDFYQLTKLITVKQAAHIVAVCYTINL